MTVKEVHKKRLTYERKFYPVIRKGLKAMLQSVIEYISLGQDITGDLLVVAMNSSVLEKGLHDLYLTTGTAFGNVQWKELQTLKQDMVFTWESEMQKYALLESGLKVTSIVGTQKDTFLGLIDVIMNEAVENGYGVEKTASFLKRELTERGIEYQKWQARRIVQTEVLGASNKAQIATANELPFDVQKKWLTGGISETERHTLIPDLHGQVRALDEPFDVGGEAMMQPGEGSPENVINCKCIVQFVRL